MSLMVSEIIQAIGGVMSVKWVIESVRSSVMLRPIAAHTSLGCFFGCVLSNARLVIFFAGTHSCRMLIPPLGALKQIGDVGNALA
jgi:hypothetical protein